MSSDIFEDMLTVQMKDNISKTIDKYTDTSLDKKSTRVGLLMQELIELGPKSFLLNVDGDARRGGRAVDAGGGARRAGGHREVLHQGAAHAARRGRRSARDHGARARRG